MQKAALGEHALRLALPASRSHRAVASALRTLCGVRDVIVTEEHAAVYFDDEPPPDELLARALAATEDDAPSPTLHVVHVRYDGEDLAAIAERVSLGVAQVVALHAGREYVVRAVGFLPGFAYLGEVDPRIALARRAAPRTRVPAGAVAIAARYTGVYPFASPGGWHLVGHAIDARVFDPDRGARFALGDRVRFEPAT